MSPDRKLFEYLKTSDPRGYGHVKTLLRICAPVIVATTLFLIIAEVLAFQDKNRFDANRYPLPDLLWYEFIGVIILSAGARLWVLSRRKE
jgi:hypothetical protein